MEGVPIKILGPATLKHALKNEVKGRSFISGFTKITYTGNYLSGYRLVTILISGAI